MSRNAWRSCREASAIPPPAACARPNWPLRSNGSIGSTATTAQSSFNTASLNSTVVSPDAGRVRVAERWTDLLGAPLAIIHKRRDPDVPNEAKVFEVVGEVEGRICVLIDDMIDTGGTIVKAA